MSELGEYYQDDTKKLKMNVNLNNTDNNDYVRGYKDGKKAGATEWAGRAKPVIDVSEEIIMLFDPTRRHVLVPADMIIRLSTALAKYKEVGNG